MQDLYIYILQSNSVISKDDKTRTASVVFAVFLLYTLVTSATPDICTEHALNTPKALHKHASTPGPRFGHVPDAPETRPDFWICASVRQVYAIRTSKARPQLALNMFNISLTRQDKVYMSKISDESQSPSVLALCHLKKKKSPAHVWFLQQCVTSPFPH